MGIEAHSVPWKKAIRKLLKTSVKSFSGWPALCQSNENTWWEGAIVLHKPAAPELCVVEVVSVLFWAAEPALGTLWLLSEGLQVPYSRTAGAVLAVQHYWKGVWGRMLAVFVERGFFLSVACALGFLGQWYMATAAWKEHCRVSSRFEQAAAQEYLDLLLQILTFGLLMSSDIFQPPKKAAVTDGFALNQARIVLFSWHPCILQPFLLFKEVLVGIGLFAWLCQHWSHQEVLEQYDRLGRSLRKCHHVLALLLWCVRASAFGLCRGGTAQEDLDLNTLLCVGWHRWQQRIIVDLNSKFRSAADKWFVGSS